MIKSIIDDKFLPFIVKWIPKIQFSPFDLRDNADENAAPTNADPDADKKALIEAIKQDLIKDGYDPDVAQEAAEAAVN